MRCEMPFYIRFQERIRNRIKIYQNQLTSGKVKPDNIGKVQARIDELKKELVEWK